MITHLRSLPVILPNEYKTLSLSLSLYIYIYIYIYINVRGAFNKFPAFFYEHLKLS